jgi:ABC-type transport system involved in multi-copper enzyme maturation permease subunit/heme exporter protein D
MMTSAGRRERLLPSLSPIFPREIRRRYRTIGPIVNRVILACIFGLLVLSAHRILFHQHHQRESSNAPMVIIMMFSSTLTFGVGMSAVNSLSGAFAKEKESKALAILLTTPLTGWAIVLSKFAAGIIAPVHTLLSGLPLLAAAVGMNFIQPSEAIRILLHLVTLTLLVASTTLFFAVHSRTESQAASRSVLVFVLAFALLTTCVFIVSVVKSPAASWASPIVSQVVNAVPSPTYFVSLAALLSFLPVGSFTQFIHLDQVGGTNPMLDFWAHPVGQAWTVIAPILASVGILAWSARRLRPEMARWIEGFDVKRRPVDIVTRMRRLLTRPPIGQMRPYVWKSLYVDHTVLVGKVFTGSIFFLLVMFMTPTLLNTRDPVVDIARIVMIWPALSMIILGLRIPNGILAKERRSGCWDAIRLAFSGQEILTSLEAVILRALRVSIFVYLVAAATALACSPQLSYDLTRTAVWTTLALFSPAAGSAWAACRNAKGEVIDSNIVRLLAGLFVVVVTLSAISVASAAVFHAGGFFLAPWMNFLASRQIDGQYAPFSWLTPILSIPALLLLLAAAWNLRQLTLVALTRKDRR